MTVKTAKSPRKPKGSGHLRRSEIIEAAQKIFAEEGYRGATVRKIAEQVGVSSTAIYLHFPDKQAMLMEIAGETISQMLSRARAIAAKREVDPLERCRRMMGAYMEYANEHPNSYAVLIEDAQREIAASEDSARDLVAEHHRTFLGVVLELAEQGRLRGANGHVVAQTLWAGCHGVISLLRANPRLRWAPYEQLRDTMIEGLLRGLVD